MRRSVASRRRASESRRGWIYFTIAAVGFVLIGVTFIALKMSARETDSKTGCPVDHYDAVTAVLVDMTDALNPTQASALRNALVKIRDTTPKFGRLEMYALAPVTKSTLT